MPTPKPFVRTASATAILEKVARGRQTLKSVGLPQVLGWKRQGVISASCVRQAVQKLLWLLPVVFLCSAARGRFFAPA